MIVKVRNAIRFCVIWCICVCLEWIFPEVLGYHLVHA